MARALRSSQRKVDAVFRFGTVVDPEERTEAMRIGRTNGIGSGFGGDRRVVGRRVEPIADAGRARPDPERASGEAPGRALVPTTAPIPRESEPERLVRLRAHAPFLAQLIATREALPQTRRLRRAEPGRAARAYGEAMDGPGLLVPGYLVDVAR